MKFLNYLKLKLNQKPRLSKQSQPNHSDRRSLTFRYHRKNVLDPPLFPHSDGYDRDKLTSNYPQNLLKYFESYIAHFDYLPRSGLHSQLSQERFPGFVRNRVELIPAHLSQPLMAVNGSGDPSYLCSLFSNIYYRAGVLRLTHLAFSV